MKKRNTAIWIILFITIFFLLSCSGGSGGASKIPEVIVATDSNLSTGDIDPDSSGDSTNNDTSTGQNTGNSNQDSSQYVVIIQTDNDGKLNINNEAVDPGQYIPSENSSSSISVTDENGNTVTAIVEDDGSIKITPSDGTVEGVYTIVINTGEREYIIVVEVDADNNPTVTTAISFPSDNSIIIDLDNGNLVVNDSVLATVSSGASGNYTIDSSVAGITVTDSANNCVSAYVDPVTGDIITGTSATGNTTVVITMTDGRVISFQTDNTGDIISNVTVAGRSVMIDLDDGYLSSGGFDITLTENGSDGWLLSGDVLIISATAGDGTITVSPDNIKVDAATGDIMITGGGSADVPSGPYELKVSVDGKEYIIKSDDAGNIITVVPGNVLLDLNNGYAIHSGNNIVVITTESYGSWSLAEQISSLQAVDSEGNQVSVVIDSSTGDLLTPDTATGEVTITFLYTDSSGNVITYTFVAVNGNILSYMAEISDPGPDFDFSTVTNVKISLKVADEKTGLPLGQVSINFMKADSSLNWEGFTNDSGISVFTATVDTANQTAKVIVAKSGYETVTCDIPGIGKLIEFGRNIAMSPVEEIIITDSDGDGVPDEDDEFPDDPSGAKQIKGIYTLAFEDLYPDKGDSDFNDVVVRLTIVEMIDGQNKLRSISITTKLLASGAAYHNRFGINIYGRKIIFIDDVRDLLGNKYNSRPYEKYKDVAEILYNLEFETPVIRKDIAPMPYDPFIMCNGETDREVHLPFVTTLYTGKRLDSDGFPWAILVPDEWAWPYESGSIFKAYPGFDDWYMSSGDYNSDWYLNPHNFYIYKR